MNLRLIFTGVCPARRRQADILMRASETILSERLYLNSALRCRDVARAIGTNRTYLWEALSQRGMGFRDYLAKFRVRHFILNAASYGGMQLEEIAELCGFNGHRQLGRYLKSMFGVTVAEYMKIASREGSAT